VSSRRWVKVAAAGIGAAVAAATAGVVAERRVVRSRRSGSTGADELGGLHGDEVTLRTSDGVDLHVEVDEVAPYTEGSKGRAEGDPTLVFVHGYALNLECWYFQRQFFRGKHRLVLYDQRSHGRSGPSDRDHATIDQLGDDLDRLLREVVPEGDVILVGHSMGGMTVMAFAERHPDTFAQRVIGTALISTSAGGLHPHRMISRLIPDSLGEQVGQRLMAGLALAPELVDRVRRRGSNIGFLMADQFAFGDEVPASYVEFVDNMLAQTSFEVLAHFFPNFDALDKFRVLEEFARIPTYVIGGTKDVLTSIGHSRKMASRIPGATLVECGGAGHMVILERKDRVNSALEEMVAAATGSRAARVS
jgi:pimeloyl-ACP methyl ester carboxylesterase